MSSTDTKIQAGSYTLTVRSRSVCAQAYSLNEPNLWIWRAKIQVFNLYCAINETYLHGSASDPK